MTHLALDDEKVTQDRWTHFEEKHASQVTWLELDIALDLESLGTMARLQGRSGQPLFRRLSRVDAAEFPRNHMDPHKDLLAPLLDLIVASNPEEFNFRENTLMKSSGGVLSMLQGKAPHIRHLTIGSNGFDYSSFTSLESLAHRGFLTKRHFKSLALLPSLETLNLYYSHHQERVEDTSSEPIIFPMLHTLFLSAPPVELEEILIESVMPALRIFQFRYHWGGEAAVRLINHFLHTCPLLEDLHLELEMMPQEVKVTRHEGIRRLLLFVFGSQAYDESDHYWDWIGRSFPELRDMTIRHGDRSHRLSWCIVSAPLIQCDRLQRLELSVDVKDFSFSETRYRDIVMPSLEVLKFKQLRIQKADLDPFARYLAKLAPSLRKIEIGDFYEIMKLSKQNRRMKEQPVDREFKEKDKDVFIGKIFEYQADEGIVEVMV